MFLILVLVGFLIGYLYGLILHSTMERSDETSSRDDNFILVFIALPTAIVAPFFGELIMDQLYGSSLNGHSGFFQFLDEQPIWLSSFIGILAGISAIFCFNFYVLLPIIGLFGATIKTIAMVKQLTPYKSLVKKMAPFFHLLAENLGLTSYQLLVTSVSLLFISIFVYTMAP